MSAELTEQRILDQQLVQAICDRNGELDDSLWGELLDRCEAAIKYHAFRCKLDEDDVRQELMLRLFARNCQRLKSWESRSLLSTWLSVVINRLCQNLARTAGTENSKRQPMPQEAVADPRTGLAAMKEALNLDLRFSQLHEAMRQLSDDEAYVLWGRHYEGTSTAELAQALGKTPNNVNQICLRAVRAVRSILEGQCNE